MMGRSDLREKSVSALVGCEAATLTWRELRRCGWLAGYREEVFRQLLKRATDVLLAPGRHEGGT
jgi:hypothetical protein